MPEVQEMRVPFLGQVDPLEEEMTTHSSILAWENPTDRGAWRATVHEVSKSQTRLSDSAAAEVAVKGRGEEDPRPPQQLWKQRTERVP